MRNVRPHNHAIDALDKRSEATRCWKVVVVRLAKPHSTFFSNRWRHRNWAASGVLTLALCESQGNHQSLCRPCGLRGVTAISAASVLNLRTSSPAFSDYHI